MFAVLKTGGKQYRVQSGDILRVEKLAAAAGETVQFNDVLMVGSTIGTPLVDGAGVQAEVIEQIKGEKVIHYVKRRRKHSSQRTKGHRQQLTLLRVTDILEKGAADSGVKAALGAGSVPGGAGEPARYAKNKADQAEMSKRVTTGEAKAKAEDAPTGAKPGNLLSEPRDGSADDLKKLSGVGPKMVTTLNEAGVYHFDQIAAWSEAEIAYMEETLPARGKVAGWAEQAKTLGSE
ncbi:50S ribosomal protein L21 [Mesobaculum littorinae]|uniref:Large ribosomal subunit protein bL21 n=1 Tax=Mesobaculum littorinae TaxID=2486419 RepID=A0A438AMD1_9RHOB|nr:50S ribosomal protein L21 [Mesobaculum littorinae]RVV99747.1 50S ribosomal protein L21 [Mesobaculum littorinae]